MPIHRQSSTPSPLYWIFFCFFFSPLHHCAPQLQRKKKTPGLTSHCTFRSTACHVMFESGEGNSGFGPSSVSTRWFTWQGSEQRPKQSRSHICILFFLGISCGKTFEYLRKDLREDS